MRRPLDIATSHTLRYLLRALGGRKGLTILEVGCGEGHLARALHDSGFRIIGLEPDEEAARKAEERGIEVLRASLTDLPAFSDQLVLSPDVIVFTRSLHHMENLDAALDRAASLKPATGLVIFEDFDLDAADQATAEFFYRHRRIHLPDDPLPGPVSASPHERWQAEHLHEHELHTGSAMLAATERRFEILAIETAPYLYRYFCPLVADDEEGWRVVRELYRLEIESIEEKKIRPVGLRWIAEVRGHRDHAGFIVDSSYHPHLSRVAVVGKAAKGDGGVDAPKRPSGSG